MFINLIEAVALRVGLRELKYFSNEITTLSTHKLRSQVRMSRLCVIDNVS